MRRPSVALLLALMGSMAVAGLTTGCSRSERPAFRNLVLITLDTLRADHLGCYGYPIATSPFLDSLAEGGVLFEQVESTSSHTGPSHASLFTSLYPYEHGVLVNGAKLRPEVPTLAEALRTHGFTTVGFSSVLFLGSVARGFGSFDRPPDSQADGLIPGAAPYRPASATVDRVVKWVSKHRGEGRFLLWVHLYDVHNSEDLGGVPESIANRMAELYRESWPKLRRHGMQVLGIDPGVRKNLGQRHRLYDTQVRFVDRELRRLHEALTVRGMNRGTLWMITADHGEGLGNHGYLGHGRHLFEEQLHVPLILHAAGTEWQVSRVRALVRQVDLLPTALELLDIPSPRRRLEGRSVAALMRRASEVPGTRFAFAQRRPKGEGGFRRNWEEGPVLAARDARFKYIWRAADRHLLFDLVNDPTETRNLFGQGLAAERKLRAFLERHIERALAAETARGHTVLEDPVRRELEALGYL